MLIAKGKHCWSSALANALTGQHSENANGTVACRILVRGVSSIPCEDELLGRRKLHVLGGGMRKPLLLGELRACPEGDTLLVESHNIGALGRPLHFPIAPNLLLLLLSLSTILLDRPANGSVVPINLGFLLVPNEELLSAFLVQQPIPEVRSRERRQGVVWNEIVRPIDNVIELVELHDLEDVVFVQLEAIHGLHSFVSALRFLVSDNDKPICHLSLLVEWHVPLVGAILVHQLFEHSHELVVFFSGDGRYVADKHCIGE
mmetsp:Transcript_36181/g.84828  ORF Transcript_36181/g.84828 Transcript_36181/m.84828 type:complete len:260 (+) Transcript_36181:1284-2063(+)